MRSVGKPRHASNLLWPLWLLANAVGASIGWWLGGRASWVFAYLINFVFASFSLWVILGFVCTISQWAVLRRYVDNASQWVVASMIGWLGAGVVSGLLNGFGWGPSASFKILSAGIFVAAIGVVVGVAQWSVLRHVRPVMFTLSQWWIWASACALGISQVVFELVSDVIGLVFAGGVFGLVYGCITIPPLAWAISRKEA